MTTVGTEYLTSQKLIDEIKAELYIHGGRVNTVDLAQEFNIDIEQLNLIVSEIVRKKEVLLVAGSLIAHYYMEEIAREINVKLQIQGQICVSDLTLQFDLPADVLHSVLLKYLGTIISGKQDPSNPTIFYTKEFIRRTKAKLRGALMGLLKPTSVRMILEHFNLKEGLFIDLFDQLNDTGMIAGSREMYWSWYQPLCYTKAQDSWLRRFYKQNNFLEYFTLINFGIPNEKEYVKQILCNEDMIFLEGCVMDVKLKHKLEKALQECVASKSFFNVQTFLNFDVYDNDIETFIVPLLKNYSRSIILINKTVCSNQFIENLKQICLPTIQKNAESVVMSGKYQQYLEKQQAKSVKQNHKAEESREKVNSGKEGCNTQAKETKGNTLKELLRPKPVVQDPDSHEAPCTENIPSSFEIISIEDVRNKIKKALENLHDNYVTQIAEYLQRDLNQTALEIAKDFSEKLFEDLHERERSIYLDI